MNNRNALLLVCIGVSFIARGADPPAPKEDDRPILHESPKRLVEYMESSIREVSACAAINVRRDAAQKRLRIFASSVQAKRGPSKVGDFEVETVFSSSLISEEKTAPACYHSLHNHHVLALAGSLMASGKKEQGRALVKLVAQAQPSLCYLPAEPPVMIGDVLTSLEKDDEKSEVILKDLKDKWDFREKQEDL